MTERRKRSLERFRIMLEQNERAIARLQIRRWRLDEASAQRRVHAALNPRPSRSAHSIRCETGLKGAQVERALADLVAAGFAAEVEPRRYVRTEKPIALRQRRRSKPSAELKQNSGEDDEQCSIRRAGRADATQSDPA